MNKTPKVTIIMSIYNNEKTVENAINSILNQTYTNLEVLLLDDKSTDDSLEIIKNFAINNPHVKIIQNKRNLGLTRSLNKLIKNSTSDYIARHDADDESHPQRIQLQMTKMLDGNLDFVSTRAVSVDGKRNIPRLIFYFPYKYILKYKNPFIHGTLLVKKEMLKKVNFYDVSYYYSQDYKLMIDMLLMKAKYKVINKPLYKLNMTNNISTKFKEEQKEYADMAKRYLREMK